jgi:hypothetical protein
MSNYNIIKTESHKRFHDYVLNLSNKNSSLLFEEYDNHYSKNKISNDYYFWSNDFLKSYFIWFIDSIKKKSISIRNPFNNTVINTDRYFLSIIKKNQLIYTVVANYCFYDNIIMGLGLGTGMGGLETRILYIICVNTKKILYNWHEIDISIFSANINNIFKKYNIFKKNYKYFNNMSSKVTTLFGFQNNIGHTLFNEITGLFLLVEEKNIKYINEVIIGTFDVFLMKEYFKNYNNVAINETKKTDVDLYSYIGKGVIFKYNHIFVSNKCKMFLKTHLNLQLYNRNSDINNDITLIIKNYPVVMIYLRYGNNEIKNQILVLSTLINNLTLKFPNAFFIFNGFCSNPLLSDTDTIGHYKKRYNVKEMIDKYISIYNEITSRMITKKYKSIINLTSCEIVEYIKISTYTIYQFNNLVTLSSWLCDIPGILIGMDNNFIDVYKKQDSVINENTVNINMIKNTSTEYDIDIKYLTNIIINQIMSITEN